MTIFFKKSLKTFMIAILLAVLFFAPTLFSVGNVNASNVSVANIKDTNVVYNSVEKTIDISEEKVLDITERITVTYKNPGINVGLSRNISKINKITRIYQGKEYVTTTINDLDLVSVTMDGEEEFNFVEEDYEYYYINTGADGDYKVGTHTYEIRYLYDMGEDFIGAFDDVTFDLMDYGFASPVESFSAQITLPKTFLTEGQSIEDVLSFRTNNFQGLGFEAVNFEISETEGKQTISCSLNDLGTYTGLTMQLILPEDYFNTSYSPNVLYWIVLASSILAVVAVVIVVIINRRKQKVVETVEFYAPKDYSPLDVARAYRGKIKSNDFASLVIYWVGKGYVSIKNEDEVITLTKLKDLPEAEADSPLVDSKKYEKEYFDSLFASGDSVTFTDSYSASASMKSSVRKLYGIEKEKKKKLYPFRTAINVISALPFVLFMLWNLVLGYSMPMTFFVAVFPIVGILVFLYLDGPVVFKVFWCLLFGGAPLYALASMLTCIYDVYGLLYITIAIFLIGNLAVFLLKAYSDQEMKDLGKILGFKNFLVTAELNRLEMLVEENPNYYYDILPFCYVFGITKKMESKFEDLRVEKPEYLGNNSAVAFGIVLSHSMRTVSRSVYASSGRSGGFGGGGFGGGRGGSFGGGGGGGGSHGR